MTARPTPNPYQPPVTVDRDDDASETIEVTFQSSARLRRYATNQYLLHWHSRRLLLASLLMILVSGACIIASFRLGVASFLLTMVAVLVIPAGIYTAMVWRTKLRIYARLKDLGLAGDALITLRSELDQLQIVQAEQLNTWSHDVVQAYRTKRGLLICPESLLFVLVPKTSCVSAESYRHLVDVIKSRSVNQESST